MTCYLIKSRIASYTYGLALDLLLIITSLNDLFYNALNTKNLISYYLSKCLQTSLITYIIGSWNDTKTLLLNKSI